MSDAGWEYGLVGGVRFKNLVYVGASKGIVYVCAVEK